MSTPSTLSGIRLLDPSLEPLANAPLRLAPGMQWPEDLDPASLWLLPGMYDLSCRLGEPGPPHPASIGSELRAARRGGFDTVLLNPDTDPVIDSVAVIEWIERRASAANGARLRLLGALTAGLQGAALAGMDGLRRAGVSGFAQGQYGLPPIDVLLSALRYAAALDRTVHLQARDPLLHQGLAAAGPHATRHGLAGIPAAAESAALGQILALVEDTGCRVHIGRISSATGVDWLRWGKSRGLPITADVSLQHLLLTDEDGAEFAPHSRFDPPLRSTKDREALLQGVADGTIDAICSDHRPHPADSYQQPLAGIPAGAAGFDSFLPLLLGAPTLQTLPLERRLQAVCNIPAAIMGEALDSARMGVLYAPDDTWEYGPQTAHSACCNAPQSGSSLRGRCIGVIIGGDITLFSLP